MVLTRAGLTDCCHFALKDPACWYATNHLFFAVNCAESQPKRASPSPRGLSGVYRDHRSGACGFLAPGVRLKAFEIVCVPVGLFALPTTGFAGVLGDESAPVGEGQSSNVHRWPTVDSWLDR